MKRLLIKSATILFPDSPFYEKKADVLIEEGTITGIDENLGDIEGAEAIDGNGKFLSPGFFDLNSRFGEPGNETSEDIDTGLSAAAAGGFTGVAVMPDTHPPVDSKGGVIFIRNRANGNLVEAFPLGCISAVKAGKELAELYDMKQAGAVAFTDGTSPVTDAGLMSRALLYAKGFDGLVFSFPEDPSIAGNGKMNEGLMNTYLGMKGIPALAEELMISRDLYLAEYNEAPIHFSTISTARSVELIRDARARGLQVTCSVTAHHLLFTEKELEGFDSNFKVKPPLRTREDADALMQGLRDGTIDVIVSQHTPREVEFKNVEFEIAAYGIIGLQTVLPMLLQAGLTPAEIVTKLAVNPRRILKLPVPQCQVGEKANFVLFDPALSWTFNEKTNRSKSSNSPWFNQTLQGGVELIGNNNSLLKF